MQVYWNHTIGLGDASGLAWFGIGTGGNGDVVNCGGYVTPIAAGPVPQETNGSSAFALYPIVATRPEFDTNYNEWTIAIAFAVPPGTQVFAHIWVATA